MRARITRTQQSTSISTPSITTPLNGRRPRLAWSGWMALRCRERHFDSSHRYRFRRRGL